MIEVSGFVESWFELGLFEIWSWPFGVGYLVIFVVDGWFFMMYCVFYGLGGG